MNSAKVLAPGLGSKKIFNERAIERALNTPRIKVPSFSSMVTRTYSLPISFRVLKMSPIFDSKTSLIDKDGMS